MSKITREEALKDLFELGEIEFEDIKSFYEDSGDLRSVASTRQFYNVKKFINQTPELSADVEKVLERVNEARNLLSDYDKLLHNDAYEYIDKVLFEYEKLLINQQSQLSADVEEALKRMYEALLGNEDGGQDHYCMYTVSSIPIEKDYNEVLQHIQALEQGVKMCNNQAKVQHKQDMQKIQAQASEIERLKVIINNELKLSAKKSNKLNAIREALETDSIFDNEPVQRGRINKIKQILEGNNE